MKESDFEQLLDRVRRNKSSSTASQYIRKIHDFREWLDGKPLEDVDAIDVEDWLAHLDETYSSASSVGKGRAALVAAYDELNKLIDAGRIDAEGWVRETPPQQASYTPKDKDTLKSKTTREDLHYLKPEQVDKLARSTGRPRDELIVRLLFQTGLRVSEMCDIRWPADVDVEARSIKVRGKGRKNRTVFYQPSLDLLMDVWITERRPAVYYADESEHLFPTSHSPRITRETVAEVVRKAAEEADLQSVYGENTKGVELHTVTPHVLRHSFAMAALDAGWDVYTLSQALGHEDTEITTSTYLHEDEERVKQAFTNRPPSDD